MAIDMGEGERWVLSATVLAWKRRRNQFTGSLANFSQLPPTGVKHVYNNDWIVKEKSRPTMSDPTVYICKIELLPNLPLPVLQIFKL